MLKPVCYAILGKSGMWMSESCICEDADVLQAELEYAREEKPSEDYKIVPLYARPAAAVDELIEAVREQARAWMVEHPDSECHAKNSARVAAARAALTGE